MSDSAGSLPSPGDERQVLTEQLARVWSLRTNQDQVLWRVFGAFWPTNAILLVALFRSGAQGPSREVGIITCAAGLFVAVVWFLLHRRALAHLLRLDSIAENLERMLALKPEHALSVGLSSVLVGHGPQARAVMRSCIVILGTCWLGGLIWFVAMYSHHK
jgi:hypothetical protein